MPEMLVKGGLAGFEQEQELGWQTGALRLRKMEEEGSVTGRVGECSVCVTYPWSPLCILVFFLGNRPLQCPAVQLTQELRKVGSSFLYSFLPNTVLRLS